MTEYRYSPRPVVDTVEFKIGSANMKDKVLRLIDDDVRVSYHEVDSDGRVDIDEIINTIYNKVQAL